MMIKTIVKYLALMIEGFVLVSIGYGITTWQWWAIIIATGVYAAMTALED